MKKIIFILFLATGCASIKNIEFEKANINTVLNNWHKAAAAAQFEAYFNIMSDNSIFIGTDAGENWTKAEFMTYAKPYFDKGKAWSFTALERHIYFSNDGKTAWFDELLNTQMKICRGSGVMQIENGSWKIKHYVLSMTIPNENNNEVIKIKAPIEEALIKKLKN